MNSQLRIKELERQNETLQAEVYQKVQINKIYSLKKLQLIILFQQDELRNHLKKEIGYDGTLVVFQSSLNDLEVRQVQRKNL